MLDKVVKLHRAGAVTSQKFDQTAPQQSGEVSVRVIARAPEGHCQLKLWNPQGRDPKPLEPSKFREKDDHTWRLEKSLDDLDGRTLTWSVRFFAPRPDRFELRVQVLHNGAEQPDGQFFYSGPLEASEVEERDGRFHFKVE
jgi:hypothetical protein